MNWFKRKPKEKPRVETAIGVFEFDKNWWSTESQTPLGTMTVSVAEKTFDPAIVPKLQELISALASWSEKALAHVRAKQPDSLTQYGKVTPYALDVTDLLRNNSFSIGYLFENWPDGELTVVFENGVPVDIWEDD